MMLPNWLLAFVVTASSTLAILALVFYHRSQTRLMRILSERSGIPATIMDNKPQVKEEPKPKPDNRKRFSVPIPGADFLRTAK